MNLCQSTKVDKQQALENLRHLTYKMYSYSDSSPDQINNDMTSCSDLTSTISSPSGSEASAFYTLESLEEENSMASSVEAPADSDSAKVVAKDTIQNLSSTNPLFMSQWLMMYSNHTNIMYMRLHCADFLTREWTAVLVCFLQDHLEGVKKFAERLFQKVLEYYDELLENATDVQSQISFNMEKNRLKNDFENDAFEFVKLVTTYLLQEDALVKRFTGNTNNRHEDMDVDDMSEVIDLHSKLDGEKKKLERLIEQLEEDMEEVSHQYEQLTTKNDSLTNLMSQTPQNGHVSANQLVVSKLQNDLQTLQENYSIQMCRVVDKKAEIITTITEMSTIAIQEATRLTEYLKKWKKSRQLSYVELHQEKSLQPIDKWCANLGKLLYDVIHYDFEKLKQLYNDEEVQKFEEIIYSLFISLLQQSFLCINQSKHFIKVEKGTKQRNKDGGVGDDKFKCPKFHATVRLLAAENIDGAKKVIAFFCREDDLVDKHQSDLDPVLQKFPLKGNEAPYEKKTRQAVFKKLELHKCKENFNKTSDKPVCEEKFRIVFKTVVSVAEKTIPLMTFSLPLVVITGASQSCNAHGSVLWQCYSMEDAFSIESKCPDRLQWSTVANMLNDKFKMLGGRDLKEQEIKHLYDRINIKVKGQPDKQEEDEIVQFKQFCVDKMMDIVEGEDNKKKSATFWMWFFAVFNLTKTYLEQEWSDGLIEGFISKKAGEELLKSQPNLSSRTFFLRFSDNIITDGQGQSMCGALSASFCYNLGGEVLVEHISPFKADKLKKKSLANLLKSVVDSENRENLLVYLYPKMQLREKVFIINSAGRRSKHEVPYGYKLIEELLTVQISNLKLEDDVSGFPEEDIAGSSKGHLGGKRGQKQGDTGTSQRTIKQAKRTRQRTSSSSDTKQAKLMDEEAVASPDSTFHNDLILVDVQPSPEFKVKEQNIPMTVYEEIEKPKGASTSLDRIKSLPCNSGSRYTAKSKVTKANSDPSVSSTSISNRYPAITTLLEKPPSSGINIPNIMADSEVTSDLQDVAMTMGLCSQTTETTTSSLGFSHGHLLVNRDLETKALQSQHTGPPTILGGGVVEGHYIDRNASETAVIPEQTLQVGNSFLMNPNVYTSEATTNVYTTETNLNIYTSEANPSIYTSETNPSVYPVETNFYPDVNLGQDQIPLNMNEHIFTTVASILESDGVTYDMVAQNIEVLETTEESLEDFVGSDNDQPDFEMLKDAE